MSRCTNATNAMYTTAINDNVIINQASFVAGVRGNGQVEAEESVTAHFQHNRRQNYRAAGGCFDVGVRQPGVHRKHRHLDRKGGEEREEYQDLRGQCQFNPW